MKALPSFTAAFAAGVLLMASLAQAAPPQPVIQIPQHSGPGLDPNADQQMDPDLVKKLTPGHSACLGDGPGYVRARIRGALNVDLSWKDAQLACSGEARPDGSGLRVSFAGPGPRAKAPRDGNCRPTSPYCSMVVGSSRPRAMKNARWTSCPRVGCRPIRQVRPCGPGGSRRTASASRRPMPSRAPGGFWSAVSISRAGSNFQAAAERGFTVRE